MSLTVSGLVAGYRGKPLLGPLDLTLQAGRLVCLIGANGAGKSTLIRTLCGMQPALAGSIHIDGQALGQMTARQRAQKLSVVLTERFASSAMTGYELACLGRYPHIGWGGRLSQQDHAVASQSLAQAGATALAAKLVPEMSDGERQKIMIARALAQQPRVLVLDEATAFLDLPRRIETMQLLLNLAREHQLAILLSTHDLELALRYADTLWLIDGERQLHVGGPEDLATSGALGRTFAAEGLCFDLQRGELRVGHAGQHAIRLEGTGIRATWAARALRRVGYEVQEQAPMLVRVDTHRYQLHAPDGEHSFDSTHALVESLLAKKDRERAA